MRQGTRGNWRSPSSSWEHKLDLPLHQANSPLYRLPRWSRFCLKFEDLEYWNPLFKGPIRDYGSSGLRGPFLAVGEASSPQGISALEDPPLSERKQWPLSAPAYLRTTELSRTKQLTSQSHLLLPRNRYKEEEGRIKMGERKKRKESHDTDLASSLPNNFVTGASFEYSAQW